MSGRMSAEPWGLEPKRWPSPLPTAIGRTWAKMATEDERTRCHAISPTQSRPIMRISAADQEGCSEVPVMVDDALSSNHSPCSRPR